MASTLQFDKLKIIIARLDCIADLDDKVFVTKISNDTILSKTYSRSDPNSLKIEVDYVHRNVKLDFTGKMLGQRYYELITASNIRYCLERINALGLCRLNIDVILENGIVGICDVTRDLHDCNMSLINNYITRNLLSSKKWLWREYRNGYSLENNVTTTRSKRRLTVYDKEHEMQRDKNIKFLSELENPELLRNHFKGCVRFEMNIVGYAAIRKLLGFREQQATYLMDVLNAETNPILTMITDATKEGELSTIKVKNLRDADRLFALEKLDWDRKKVEAYVRSHLSKNTSFSKTFEPYSRLIDAHEHQTSNGFDLRKLLS